MTAEAGLRARILAAIRLQWPRRTGVLIWGRPASMATGPGHSDLAGIVRGRAIALEIKKAKGKATPLQEQRLRDVRDAGGYAWIVRSPHEACDAVYWTAKGFTRPMSDQPLDLSEWLMGSPAQEPAAPFEPAAQAAPDDSPFNFEPLSSPYTEEHHHAVDVVTGRTREQQLQDLDARDDALNQVENSGLDAQLTEQDKADILEEAITLHELVRGQNQLDDDLRAVGDRVTLVWEMLSQYTAVLASMHRMMERLMAMVDDDAGVQEVPQQAEPEPVPITVPPRKRQSRKRKTEFVIADMPGDTEPEAVSEPEPPAENGTSAELSEALNTILSED